MGVCYGLTLEPKGFDGLKSNECSYRCTSILSGVARERYPKCFAVIELKSLILAQIERWRNALHMQVERQHGGNPGGEWRTGE